MSTINTQAEFNALLQANESRYEDDNTPTQINTAITMAPGTGATMTTLRAIVTDTDAAFTGDNCWINFNTNNSNAQGNTSQPTTTGGHWGRGPLSLRNSIITVTGNVNFQWPGWANPGDNNRYTADFSNAFLRHSVGTGAWTLHFGGAAGTGNAIGGATLSDGVVAFAAPGQFDWINVVFGPSTTQSFSLGQAYYRWNQLQDSTLDARWDGFFGCDLRGWTDTTANTHHIGSFLVNGSFDYTYSGTARNNNTMRYYYYDIIYSPEIIANGMRARTRGNDVAVDLSFGSTFNPSFRDAASLAQITDVEIDLGSNTVVYAAAAPGTAVATIKNTHLTQMNLTNGNAIVRPSDHHGFMVEQAFYNHTPGAGTYQIPGSATVPAAIPASNFWSYTHECYDASGDVSTITPVAGTFESAGIFRAGTEQLQDLNADANLNGNTLAQATTLNTAGADSLDNFYPSLKAYAYNNRTTNFPAVVEGSTFAITLPYSVNPNSNTRIGETSGVLRTASAVALGNTINTFEARGVAITITNATWPDNMIWVSTEPASLVDFGGTAAVLGAGTTFNGRFSGIGSSHIETGQTVIEGSELDIHFQQDSFDITDITITGTGTIELAKPIGDAITIRVPNGMLARFTAGAGVTLQELPAAAFALTVQTPELPGNFGVIRLTSGLSTVVVDAQRTSTSTRGTYTIPAGDSNTYRFYWKQDNTADVSAAQQGEGFFTTVIERSNSGLTANMTETMEPTPIFALLYSGDNSIPGNVTVETPIPGSTAAGNEGIRLLIDNPNTNVSTTAGPSQYEVLSATNNTRYLQTMLERGLTVDFMTPPSSGSVLIDARYAQLDTATAGQQQRLVGAEFSNIAANEFEAFTNSDVVFVANNSDGTTLPRWSLNRTSDASYIGSNIRWPGTTGGEDLRTDQIYLQLIEPTGGNTSIGDEIVERLNREVIDPTTVAGSISILNRSDTALINYGFRGIRVFNEAAQRRIEIDLTNVSAAGASQNTPTVNAEGIFASTLGGSSFTGFQDDQIVLITGTASSGGSLEVASVNILPNPAGATPTQIQDATTLALNASGITEGVSNAAVQAEAAATAATSNLTVSMDSQNAVGYILGTDGDTRLLGIKPRSGNYNASTNYRRNVTGE